MLKAFIHATILLVLITDPLGNIPLFIAALGRVPPARKTRVILRECAIAFGILLIAMLAGRSILELLDITDDTMKAAGGLILLLIAINMIFPGAGARLGEGPSEGEPLIVPIAVPLISGPSAVAAAMLVAAENPSGILMCIGALLLCIGITAAVLFASSWIKKALGEQIIVAIERLMGLILTAVAMGMLMSGVGSYIAHLR